MFYKNTASQKISVFAYNSTTAVAATGDAANITAQISLDGGTSAATNDVNPTELDATDHPGIYLFDITQAESNANLINLSSVSSTTNVLLEPVIIYTEPTTRDVNVTQWNSVTVPTPSVSGVPKIDLVYVNGIAASGSGTPDVNVASISSGVDLTASMKSSINIEVLDVLATDVFAELGSVPAASSSLKDKIAFLFMLARNKITQTSTTQLLKADDGSTTVGTATVSDDGTTFTKGEMS